MIACMSYGRNDFPKGGESVSSDITYAQSDCSWSDVPGRSFVISATSEGSHEKDSDRELRVIWGRQQFEEFIDSLVIFWVRRSKPKRHRPHLIEKRCRSPPGIFQRPLNEFESSSYLRAEQTKGG